MEKLRANLKGQIQVLLLVGVFWAGAAALGKGRAYDFEFLGLEGVVLAVLADVLKANALSG